MAIDASQFSALEKNPSMTLEGALNGAAYQANIMIPNYGQQIKQHFRRSPGGSGLAFPFRHFGLSITFNSPTELKVHNEGRQLDCGLRSLLDRFGPLSFSNAYLPDGMRSSEQRNVFDSLNFHIDRGRTQDDNISLFWRDPFDSVQREPRSSQTLVLANAAAYLQAIKQGREEHNFSQRYTLFKDEDVTPLIGNILIELGWRAPTGVGEIALVDNHRMLHASYYPHPWKKGYPISVRYVY